MPSEFVHLHIHSDFSMLDGACKINELAELAKSYNMKAMALTDHGNLCGAVQFYKTMKNNDIKPIIGCECYLAPESRFDRNQNHDYHKGYHQILYAKDFGGYQNICRLTSLAYLEGYYFKPRIDKELLQQYNDGIIGTSSCIGGEIPAHIRAGNTSRAKESLADYIDILGKDNFYLELQDHGMKEQLKVNQELIKLSKEFGTPLIATNDTHYLLKEHAAAHEVLLCIGTQKTMQDDNRMRFPSEEFYFKSTEEMVALFKEIPEAIKNTLELAEKCNIKLELNSVNHYPVFKTPDGSDRKQFLVNRCKIGLIERYNIELDSKTIDQLSSNDRQIIDRMNYEIDVIDKMGFSSYFLVVWDFLNYARSKKIPIGPGRGSGAGSIVAYLLKITDIDPLRYQLLFERFLNPDRISPPDFDIDLCERRRSEVIEYVRRKYGDDSVAQIGTFGTLKTKAVIKDVTRAMGRPFDDGIKLTKLIPNDPRMKLNRAFDEIKELKSLKNTESWVDEVYTYSEPLEGLNRNMSIHAAGVIIGDQPLTNLVPLARGQGKEIITQFPAGPCEELGLLKMDFLGLRTLTIIHDTCDLINSSSPDSITPESIPLDDEITYNLIKKGKTVAIFQLESSGMRDLCRRFGVDRIEDIIALVALYRPGPMQFLDEFIARKMGKKKVEYDHPAMESILEETYGIMLYQEQVMQIVQTVAGFTLAQADILRRTMGKKKADEMKAQFEEFSEGCRGNGIKLEKAKKIFEKIEMFAGYGFNKSHSAAYAVLAYQTAFLKANYLIEFMCVNLSNELHSADRISILIAECKDLDITILPPDVNYSDLNFTVDGSSIRFGLAAIKGVGAAGSQAIIESRKDGKFSTLFEFYERVGTSINRRIMENLCQCGAFDGFNLKRSQMFAMIDDVISRAQISLRDKQIGQENFFDILSENDETGIQQVEIPEIREWTQKQRLNYEKELLGFYVTGHPLNGYEKIIKTYGVNSIIDLKNLSDNQTVRVGGLITSTRVRYSKRNGNPWAIINLEDFSNTAECLIYSDLYSISSALLNENDSVFIEGNVSFRDGEDQAKIIGSKVISLENAPVECTREINIRIIQSEINDRVLSQLKALIQEHPGEIPIVLTLICDNEQIAFIRTAKPFTINFTLEFEQKVNRILGDNSVLIKASDVVNERENRNFRYQTKNSV